jgi:hypothetical protein
VDKPLRSRLGARRDDEPPIALDPEHADALDRLADLESRRGIDRGEIDDVLLEREAEADFLVGRVGRLVKDPGADLLPDLELVERGAACEREVEEIDRSSEKAEEREVEAPVGDDGGDEGRDERAGEDRANCRDRRELVRAHGSPVRSTVLGKGESEERERKKTDAGILKRARVDRQLAVTPMLRDLEHRRLNQLAELKLARLIRAMGRDVGKVKETVESAETKVEDVAVVFDRLDCAGQGLLRFQTSSADSDDTRGDMQGRDRDVRSQPRRRPWPDHH